MFKSIDSIKFALGLEYDGSDYHGWQRQQQGVLTVQETVEKAISIVSNDNINVICAGRTDSGVHSFGQVIHFKTTVIRKNRSWLFGINSYLPKNISIKWIKKVSNNFHARYSAIARIYRYIIYNHNCKSSIFYNKVNHIHYFLNIQAMCQASKLILGEHDFSSFRSKKCQSNTPYRKIIYINIFKYKMFVFIDIKANSFLQHMVRNIVSCLIQIGIMKKKVDWIIDVLKKKNRDFCAPTASSKGLYLIAIDYPSCFNIPKNYL